MLAGKSSANPLPASEEDVHAACYFGSLATLYPNITHELRGKLSNIVLHLELLKEMQSDAEPDGADLRQRPLAETALQEVYGFNRALQCLLDLMQPVEERTRAFDLAQVLRDLGVLVEAQAKRQRIAPRFNIDAPLEIDGNTNQIRQAIINLILMVMADLPTAGTLEVTASRQGDQINVVIKGGSRGEAEGSSHRRYEPPHRTMEHQRLRLSMAQSIIARHGGSLDVSDLPAAPPALRIGLPMGGARGR